MMHGQKNIKLWRTVGIAPPILDLDVTWRSEFSYPPWLLHSCRNSHPPSTHWIEAWVGPGAGLEALEKKFVTFIENRTRLLGYPAPWPWRYAEWAIAASWKKLWYKSKKKKSHFFLKIQYHVSVGWHWILAWTIRTTISEVLYEFSFSSY